MAAYDCGRFDLIVVGGGPAGASAAITAAEEGWRVLLLERYETPVDKPGETLHPGVEPIFRQLGVWEAVEAADFPRHPGIHSSWGGSESFAAYGGDASGEWLGIQAWRPALESILLRRAEEVGVEVIRPIRAIRPITGGTRVIGVETDRGDFLSDLLLDASGHRQWLARHLDLPVDIRSKKLIVSYGYLDSEDNEGAPRLEGDREGWTWHAPVGNGRTAWVALRLDGARPQERAKRIDVTWRSYQAAGDGYRLIGDAAFVLDPTSSHGVLKALMSGIAAIKMPSNQYAAWMAAWFGHDCAKLREAYAQLS